MCHFVSYIMMFQKIIVYKTPPGGGEGGLFPAQGLQVIWMLEMVYVVHEYELLLDNTKRNNPSKSYLAQFLNK